MNNNDNKSTKNELIYFENEILGDMKKFETKLNEKLAQTASFVETQYEKYESKIKELTNKVEVLSKQISEKDNTQKFENLLKHSLQNTNDLVTKIDIKLGILEKDFNNACFKYDKIFTNNLVIPGLIGDSCPYESLRPFLEYAHQKIYELLRAKEKHILDTKRYKEKLESLIGQNKIQFETAQNKISDYCSKGFQQCDNVCKDRMSIIEKRVEALRLENGQHAFDLKKKAEELKIKWDKLDKIENHLNQKFNDEWDKYNDIVDKINAKYDKNKEEFKIIKNRFTELSEFIKDIRFRKNMGETTINEEFKKRRQYREMSNKIDFTKKQKINKMPSIFQNKKYEKNEDILPYDNLKENEENDDNLDTSNDINEENKNGKNKENKSMTETNKHINNQNSKKLKLNDSKDMNVNLSSEIHNNSSNLKRKEINDFKTIKKEEKKLVNIKNKNKNDENDIYNIINYNNNINNINNQNYKGKNNIKEIKRKKQNYNDDIFLSENAKINNLVLGAELNRDNFYRMHIPNLSQAYLLIKRRNEVMQKMKKSQGGKSEPKFFQLTPSSIGKNTRSNLNNFNLYSIKDLRRNNMEDLYYTSLRKDRLNNLSPNPNIILNITNQEYLNYIDKNIFPKLYKDSQNQINNRSFGRNKMYGSYINEVNKKFRFNNSNNTQVDFNSINLNDISFENKSMPSRGRNTQKSKKKLLYSSSDVSLPIRMKQQPIPPTYKHNEYNSNSNDNIDDNY